MTTRAVATVVLICITTAAFPSSPFTGTAAAVASVALPLGAFLATAAAAVVLITTAAVNVHRPEEVFPVAVFVFFFFFVVVVLLLALLRPFSPNGDGGGNG